MAYTVVRLPKLSPHWCVQDRLTGHALPVPGGEGAAWTLAEALGTGRVRPSSITWLPVTASALGEPTAREEALDATDL